MNTSIDILALYRALLETFRNDRSAWSQVSFQLISGDGKEKQDANGIARYGVLRALQFDLQPSDEALVRFLLEQEVKARAVYPLSNILWAHELAIYLLATFRRPTDLPLLWRAKIASFDSFCGISTNYLYRVGGRNALSSVADEESNPPELQQLLWDEVAQQPIPTSEELQQWWEAQEREYPAHPDEETAEQRFAAAARLGAKEEASYWLGKWQEQAERRLSYHELQSILYHRNQRRQMSDAYQLALLQQSTPQYQEHLSLRIVTHHSLSELATKLDRYPLALDYLRTMIELVANDPNSHQGGAQAILPLLLDLVIAASSSPSGRDREIARLSYKEAIVLGSKADFLPLQILRKVERAAGIMDDIPTANHYAERISAEQQRIEEQIKRVQPG